MLFVSRVVKGGVCVNKARQFFCCFILKSHGARTTVRRQRRGVRVEAQIRVVRVCCIQSKAVVFLIKANANETHQNRGVARWARGWV